MHDTIEAKVQLRLVELKQLLQQRLQLLVFLAHYVSRSSLRYVCRRPLIPSLQASPMSLASVSLVAFVELFRQCSQRPLVCCILNCGSIDHDQAKFHVAPSVAGLSKPKYAWTSSRSCRDSLSLKDQLHIPVPELPRETSLHPHDRIDRHL